MTHYLYIGIITLLVIIVALQFLNKKKVDKLRARKLLTKGEYKMYFVLKEALPEHVILVQVGFAAMLQAENWSTINKFLRKRADYVICDEYLNILLILELDGWSHKGREKEDSARDKLLMDVGYKVLHLDTIPEPEEMRDIFYQAVGTGQENRTISESNVSKETTKNLSQP